MDADRVIKQAREGWANPDQGVLCRSCLQPVTVYGQDLNGDPVFDPVCPTCVARILMRRATQKNEINELPAIPRRHCNRCYNRPPLAGMAWCGPCAIAFQETLRGTEADALINARARHFRDRMVDSGPGCPMGLKRARIR